MAGSEPLLQEADPLIIKGHAQQKFKFERVEQFLKVLLTTLKIQLPNHYNCIFWWNNLISGY